MDQERLSAEQRMLDLVAELKASGETVDPDVLDRAKRVSVLDDAVLARDLRRLKHQAKYREQNDESNLRQRTLHVIRQRSTSDEVVSALKSLPGFNAWGPEGDADEFERYLSEALGISVAEDGVCEVDRLVPLDDFRLLLGELPVSLYHHTATGDGGSVQASIERQGLVVGRSTNFFNTQAGVYVTTRRAGMPHQVYSRRATLVHGGDPIVWRCAVSVVEIEPDPDDADLAWAQGRQFVVPSIPPWRVGLSDVFPARGDLVEWIESLQEASVRGLTPDDDRMLAQRPGLAG